MNSNTIEAISQALLAFTRPSAIATAVNSEVNNDPRSAIIGGISVIEGTASFIGKSNPAIGIGIGITSLVNNLTNIQDSARNNGTINMSDVLLATADVYGIAGGATLAASAIAAGPGLPLVVGLGVSLLIGSAVLNIAALAAGKDAYNVPEIKAMNDAVSKFINDLGEVGKAITDALLDPKFWDAYAEKGTDVFAPLLDPLSEIGHWLGQHLPLIPQSVLDFFHNAQTWVQPIYNDPLVLDLDNDGIETTGINGWNGVLFDHNNDGIKTATGWLSGDDGFLVLDKNGNGTIDNGNELFGDNTHLTNGAVAADGFAALADLDSNQDGVMDANDAVFANLRVWQDLNQDGISQPNELKTLSELSITSISITDSLFTKEDGSNATKSVCYFYKN